MSSARRLRSNSARPRPNTGHLSHRRSVTQQVLLLGPPPAPPASRATGPSRSAPPKRNPRNGPAHARPVDFGRGASRAAAFPTGLTYQTGRHCPAVVRAVLEGAGLARASKRTPSSFDLLWVTGPVPARRFASLARHQIINRIPRTILLARKDLLCRSMRAVEQRAPDDAALVPESFVLPDDKEVRVARSRPIVQPGD